MTLGGENLLLPFLAGFVGGPRVIQKCFPINRKERFLA